MLKHTHQLNDQCFDNFAFVPRSMVVHHSTAAVISVFHDLGLTERWSIHRETLSRFIVAVQNGYRDPPYHNWLHALSVFHFVYVLIKRLRLVQQEYVTDLEALSLLVASLCHDIDHRGTTNSFQLATKSRIAALYNADGSVMERHHYAKTVGIFNTVGCNIFENLTAAEYCHSLDLIQKLILDTDVTRHSDLYAKLQQLLKADFVKTQTSHRELLLSLLIVTGDFSEHTKDWNNAKNTAMLVYGEFFIQGDMEKKLGRQPAAMMDRERACIPHLQIQFYDRDVLPVYLLLARLFPETTVLVEAVSCNRQHWVTAHENSGAHPTTSSPDVVEEGAIA